MELVDMTYLSYVACRRESSSLSSGTLKTKNYD